MNSVVKTPHKFEPFENGLQCKNCGFQKLARWHDEQKEHKDPNGETCRGKKESQYPKCWHCDTCPYVECAEEKPAPNE